MPLIPYEPKYIVEDIPFCLGLNGMFYINDVLIKGTIHSYDRDGFYVATAVYGEVYCFIWEVDSIPVYDKYRNTKLFQLIV